MAREYELVVIGTGTAATGVATRVRAAGRRVAMIDFRPPGGTCALRGCDPKKMLVGGAEAFDHARRMHGKGVTGDTRIDWRQLMAFKRSFTDPVPARNERRYADQGMDFYRGRARFAGPNAVELADGDILTARHVVIACGAEPVRLNIPGAAYLVDNEGFLSLETLPARIALVGGGYIAAEFSHVAARAGAQVTILQHGGRLLKQFDPELVEWLMEAFRALGIDVHVGTAVEAIEQAGGAYRVLGAKKDGKVQVEADLVVHAAGRAPAFDELKLGAAGVALEDGRLKLNAFLQSVSNPAVYAAGDAARIGPPLTPVSGHDAKVVAANLLEGNHSRPDYRGVPSVAFTIPPIAAVGLTEDEARNKGIKCRVRSRKASDWYTAVQAAEPVYGFKTLVEEATDRVLGVHLVGPHAQEVINLFALAIRHGLTAEALKTTMFAYPTSASDIGYML